MEDVKILPSSFRDPSGFLFCRDGILYRQINNIYREHYDYFITSGLYDSLVKDNLIISHREVNIKFTNPDIAYKVIQPEMIPFISYPYEWSFSQLKDAALTTLVIQKRALQFNMTLKDCSAYNIQFFKGKPVLIDTLSFEKYEEGQPWTAYRQFCQHFLAPLALMSFRDVRLGQLGRIYIDGIPLDLASKSLPLSTKFKFSILSHIHLHARSQTYYADKQEKIDSGKLINERKLNRIGLLGIIDNLESAITNLKWNPTGTEWAEYYQDINYTPRAFEHKKQIIAGYINRIKPGIVWDLGANIGIFSRISAEKGILTIAFDNDESAVDKNYKQCKEQNETNILPLLVDLTNPAGGIGWDNNERMTLRERGKADVAMALALIHHLAISNNVPFNKIAEFFNNICEKLIIEFVPKSDSQVRRLLVSRKDIYSDYSQQFFEEAMSLYFSIVDSVKIDESDRVIYLMSRHS